MKKSIKTMLIGLLMLPVVAFSIPAVAGAQSASQVQSGVDSVASSDTCLFTNGTTCKDGIVTKIINTALFIIGVLSVVMLIYGGIRYTISAGDKAQVEAAKNTILYAIIGIVVALLAGAIVNFVLTTLM